MQLRVERTGYKGDTSASLEYATRLGPDPHLAIPMWSVYAA
ncbi:hypothetical protein Mhypo_01530 [Meiothermus hypogaeus]|uniref:Uncharacterized protein n=1 Tax=Meiothermus hypogaeus TaxID=884155 RepID=A0ABX9MN98_9DEIN|nr:hypothetical protein Mhypo_01530 [Meiothermus hypogaeus]